MHAVAQVRSSKRVQHRATVQSRGKMACELNKSGHSASFLPLGSLSPGLPAGAKISVHEYLQSLPLPEPMSLRLPGVHHVHRDRDLRREDEQRQQRRKRHWIGKKRE